MAQSPPAARTVSDRDLALGRVRPYLPADGVTLRGPFLTAGQLRARFGDLARAGRTLLGVASPIGVGVAYPSFQFGPAGQTRAVAFLAPLLVRRVGHEAACDWLLRVQPALGMASPLAWLESDRDVRPVLELLPEPTQPLPGIEGVDAMVLEFRRRWSPPPYLERAAA